MGDGPEAWRRSPVPGAANANANANVSSVGALIGVAGNRADGPVGRLEGLRKVSGVLLLLLLRVRRRGCHGVGAKVKPSWRRRRGQCRWGNGALRRLTGTGMGAHGEEAEVCRRHAAPRRLDRHACHEACVQTLVVMSKHTARRRVLL